MTEHEPILDYGEDGVDWQQQQDADQEWLELNDAINTICSGMRTRGNPDAANALETNLRGFFGVHSADAPHTQQQRFEFHQDGDLPF